MISLAAVLAAVLVAAGVYLILGRNLLRVVVGFCLLSHAANIVLISVGGDPTGKTDAFVVVSEDGTVQNIEQYVDPLPQALILTAIVISFAVTAFMIALVYRYHRDTGTMLIDEPDPPPAGEQSP